MRPIDADKIIEYCTDKSDDDFKSWMFVEFMACIDEMPTLELEPVRYGKWIPVWDYDESDGSKWIISYQCSLCDGCVNWLDNGYNRCPHCGAKMSE